MLGLWVLSNVLFAVLWMAYDPTLITYSNVTAALIVYCFLVKLVGSLLYQLRFYGRTCFRRLCGCCYRVDTGATGIRRAVCCCRPKAYFDVDDQWEMEHGDYSHQYPPPCGDATDPVLVRIAAGAAWDAEADDAAAAAAAAGAGSGTSGSTGPRAFGEPSFMAADASGEGTLAGPGSGPMSLAGYSPNGTPLWYAADGSGPFDATGAPVDMLAAGFVLNEDGYLCTPAGLTVKDRLGRRLQYIEPMPASVSGAQAGAGSVRPGTELVPSSSVLGLPLTASAAERAATVGAPVKKSQHGSDDEDGSGDPSLSPSRGSGSGIGTGSASGSGSGTGSGSGSSTLSGSDGRTITQSMMADSEAGRGAGIDGRHGPTAAADRHTTRSSASRIRRSGTTGHHNNHHDGSIGTAGDGAGTPLGTVTASFTEGSSGTGTSTATGSGTELSSPSNHDGSAGTRTGGGSARQGLRRTPAAVAVEMRSRATRTGSQSQTEGSRLEGPHRHDDWSDGTGSEQDSSASGADSEDSESESDSEDGVNTVAHTVQSVTTSTLRPQRQQLEAAAVQQVQQARSRSRPRVQSLAAGGRETGASTPGTRSLARTGITGISAPFTDNLSDSDSESGSNSGSDSQSDAASGSERSSDAESSSASEHSSSFDSQASDSQGQSGSEHVDDDTEDESEPRRPGPPWRSGRGRRGHASASSRGHSATRSAVSSHMSSISRPDSFVALNVASSARETGAADASGPTRAGGHHGASRSRLSGVGHRSAISHTTFADTVQIFAITPLSSTASATASGSDSLAASRTTAPGSAAGSGAGSGTRFASGSYGGAGTVTALDSRVSRGSRPTTTIGASSSSSAASSGVGTDEKYAEAEAAAAAMRMRSRGPNLLSAAPSGSSSGHASSGNLVNANVRASGTTGTAMHPHSARSVRSSRDGGGDALPVPLAGLQPVSVRTSGGPGQSAVRQLPIFSPTSTVMLHGPGRQWAGADGERPPSRRGGGSGSGSARAAHRADRRSLSRDSAAAAPPSGSYRRSARSASAGAGSRRYSTAGSESSGPAVHHAQSGRSHEDRRWPLSTGGPAGRRLSETDSRSRIDPVLGRFDDSRGSVLPGAASSAPAGSESRELDHHDDARVNAADPRGTTHAATGMHWQPLAAAPTRFAHVETGHGISVIPSRGRTPDRLPQRSASASGRSSSAGAAAATSGNDAGSGQMPAGSLSGRGLSGPSSAYAGALRKPADALAAEPTRPIVSLGLQVGPGTGRNDHHDHHAVGVAAGVFGSSLGPQPHAAQAAGGWGQAGIVGLPAGGVASGHHTLTVQAPASSVFHGSGSGSGSSGVPAEPAGADGLAPHWQLEALPMLGAQAAAGGGAGGAAGGGAPSSRLGAGLNRRPSMEPPNLRMQLPPPLTTAGAASAPSGAQAPAAATSQPLPSGIALAAPSAALVVPPLAAAPLRLSASATAVGSALPAAPGLASRPAPALAASAPSQSLKPGPARPSFVPALTISAPAEAAGAPILTRAVSSSAASQASVCVPPTPTSTVIDISALLAEAEQETGRVLARQTLPAESTLAPSVQQAGPR